jgi:hypothetical protein
MIVKNPNALTKLEIWFPKYSSAYTELEERVVLLAKYKVDAGSPVLIIEFTKAKHLMRQRYCIPRHEVQTMKVDSNGKIPVYIVPMSRLYTYDTVEDVKQTVDELFFYKKED